MKLYATVSSERATKGQGGNEFIVIELKNARQELVYSLEYTEAGISLYDAEAYKLYGPDETKGEKQKGEEVCEKCAAKTILYATAYRQGGWHCFNCGHDNKL